jgi:signal transduction histidine kinase
MFINSAEVTFNIYLKEKVPNVYIDDTKKRIFDSLIEAGIDPAIENKKVNLKKDGFDFDNNSRKALIDSFQVPILVNDVLIGMFCFGSTAYLKNDKMSVLEIYEGVRRKFSDFSKYLGDLQEDKDRFEDLINSMRNPVAMLGRNFELLYINPAFEDLLKLSSKKDFNILDFSKSMPKNLDIEKTLQDVFISSEPRIFKNINYHGFIYDISFFPVVKLSKVIGISILFQEVTSEYQNEKIKQEFTAMLVHELRAPLSVIKSSSDLLLKRHKDIDEKKKKQFLNSIFVSADSMLSLVSDLLDTSKLEMDRLQISKRVSGFNSFLEEKVSFFQNELEAKKIKLIISLDNKLEEYSYDENKFTQVINNLMSNAIKSTEKGYIKVATKVFKDHIQLDFEDTGHGIPDDQKSKLFNKFTQLEESVKNKSRGTGLGLVVVKGIVNAHGGIIKVLDNKPRGAIFRLELPLNQ